MRVPNFLKMVFTAEDIAWFIFYHLDRNLIGDEGCGYLS